MFMSWSCRCVETGLPSIASSEVPAADEVTEPIGILVADDRVVQDEEAAPASTNS
jgi:hypothetical protein